MKWITSLVLVLTAISLSGCLSRIESDIAKFAGRQAAQEITLPTPPANTKSEIAAGDWCQVMKDFGWPDVGIKYMDVGPSAKTAVLKLFDYGAQHCGWSPPTA